MAAISKSGTPSLSTPVPPTSCSVSGLVAGEALAAGDACMIKTSDGKVYRSIGTANDANAAVDGFAPAACPAGETTSLFWHVTFNYGASLSPGSMCYLDTSAGGLSTTTTTGGLTVIGRVIDATRIWVQKSY